MLQKDPMKILLIKSLPTSNESNRAFNRNYPIGSLFTKLIPTDNWHIYKITINTTIVGFTDYFPIYQEETNCFKEIPND